ncbi:MAG: N-acetylglucosamine-6-phosphate deacetylase [Alphaproteobacteria bacterium]|nr:N-acetylglucosamine-6-phosphate deacetylase [Alphaproteobacteria bacterium]
MSTAFVNGRILVGGTIATGMAVVARAGRIESILPRTDVPTNARAVDLEGGTLVPGFIDIQVNGGGGVLFNDRPTLEGLQSIARAHALSGTTGFLPTTVSADLDTIAQAIAAVDQAIAGGIPGILGIHIEGPFLSPSRSGIHDPANFREIDERAIALLSSLKRGKTLVTLAPEIVKPGVIEALSKAGVAVCAGHTDATFEETQAALAAGLRGFTHVFNAMTPLKNREPGVVGAALDDRDSWCGIIMDGFHVHPAVLRMAYRAKGPDKLMLVTDAMPPVGSAAKTFRLQGRIITAKDGVCVAPDGTLAGTDIGMATAVRNAMTFLNIGLAGASRMASANPAAFLGLRRETGEIARGARADFVLLGDALEVRQTWVGGEPQIPVS